MEKVLASEGLSQSERELSRIPTWMYVAFIVVVEGIIAWGQNEFLVTPDVIMAASGGQLDLDQAERVLWFSQRFEWLSYAAIAPSVFVRLALVALLLQLAVLVFESIPAKLGLFFRAATIAHVAKVAESFVGLFWSLQADGSERTARFLAGKPLSLGFFLDREGPLSAFTMIADSVSVASAAWIIVVTWILAAELRQPRRAIVITCLMVWFGMVAMRFALAQALPVFAS